MAERLGRGGTKRFRTAEKTLTKHCSPPGERNPCITAPVFAEADASFRRGCPGLCVIDARQSAWLDALLRRLSEAYL